MREKDEKDDKVRLDKWLWAARFFKTRSLAQAAVAGGKVRVGGERVKPAKELAVGDGLTIRIGEFEWAVTVKALSDKRGPAQLARKLYEEDEANSTPQKLGLFNTDTWGAYALGDLLFMKRTEAFGNRRYPDFGSSFETFTNAEFLELEFLGPLRRIAKGQSESITEHWSLKRGVDFGGWTEDDVDRALKPLLAERPPAKKVATRR